MINGAVTLILKNEYLFMQYVYLDFSITYTENTNLQIIYRNF